MVIASLCSSGAGSRAFVFWEGVTVPWPLGKDRKVTVSSSTQCFLRLRTLILLSLVCAVWTSLFA